MELDLQNPLTSLEDQTYDGMKSLFANESDHMPSCLLSFHSSDVRFSTRRTAISIISRTKSSNNLDPFLVYLSVNYVDRFLSKQEILDKKPWIARILAIASLSLAAKMTDSGLPFSLNDLQERREEGYILDAQSVHRMETIMLTALQWRMRSITPFSFLHYFLSLFPAEDSALTQSLKRQASDILFSVQPIMELSKYKPSVLAASALLCAVHDLIPLKFSACEDAIFSCQYMDHDALSECLGAMQLQGIVAEEGCRISVHETANGALTPVSVLDHQRTSPRSDNDGSGFPGRDRFKGRGQMTKSINVKTHS